MTSPPQGRAPEWMSNAGNGTRSEATVYMSAPSLGFPAETTSTTALPPAETQAAISVSIYIKLNLYLFKLLFQFCCTSFVPQAILLDNARTSCALQAVTLPVQSTIVTIDVDEFLQPPLSATSAFPAPVQASQATSIALQTSIVQLPVALLATSSSSSVAVSSAVQVTSLHTNSGEQHGASHAMSALPGAEPVSTGTLRTVDNSTSLSDTLDSWHHDQEGNMFEPQNVESG